MQLNIDHVINICYSCAYTNYGGMMNNMGFGNGALEKCTTGCNNVIIGAGSNSSHDNCVIIGTNLDSDYDYQVKVGNEIYNKSRVMTVGEYDTLFKAITDMVTSVSNG